MTQYETACLLRQYLRKKLKGLQTPDHHNAKLDTIRKLANVEVFIQQLHNQIDARYSVTYSPTFGL